MAFFAPGIITAAQAANLDATVSSRAPSSTALSTAQWTAALAGTVSYLGRGSIAAFGPRQTRPSLAGAASASTAAGAWTMGGYVTVVAANVLGTLIMLVGGTFDLNGDQWQVDIATGGVGAEVVVATLSGINLTHVGEAPYRPISPFISIPDNSRVAIRAAAATGGGATMRCYLDFAPSL